MQIFSNRFSLNQQFLSMEEVELSTSESFDISPLASNVKISVTPNALLTKKLDNVNESV